MMPALRDAEVNVIAKPPEQPSWWMSLLSSILPILILIGVWFSSCSRHRAAAAG